MTEFESQPEGELIPQQPEDAWREPYLREVRKLNTVIRDSVECSYTTNFAGTWFGLWKGDTWEEARDFAIQARFQCDPHADRESLVDLIDALMRDEVPSPFEDVADLVDALDGLDRIFDDESEYDATDFLVCLAVADARRDIVRFPRWLNPRFVARLQKGSDWEPKSYDDLFSAEFQAHTTEEPRAN
jgi:hypothetical protein